MRSLSFAIAGVGFLALLDSALSLYQTHGPKEQTGPPEKLTIAISTDMNPVLVTPVMFPTIRGAGFSILATIQPPDKNEAAVTRKDRGIASMANLKGQIVSVAPGTAGDYSLHFS